MPGITGHDLIAKLEEQMAVAPIDQFLGETVEDVIKEDDGTFTIKSAKRVSRSRAVIIALGNGAFTPRKLALEEQLRLKASSFHILLIIKLIMRTSGLPFLVGRLRN